MPASLLVGHSLFTSALSQSTLSDRYLMNTKNDGNKARGAVAYLLGAVAFLTCPCHLPVMLVLLSGTAAGALMAENIGLSLIVLLVLFIFSASATWRLVARRR